MSCHQTDHLVRGDPRVGSTPAAGNLSAQLPLRDPYGSQSVQSAGELDVPKPGEMAGDLR